MCFFFNCWKHFNGMKQLIFFYLISYISINQQRIGFAVNVLLLIQKLCIKGRLQLKLRVQASCVLLQHHDSVLKHTSRLSAKGCARVRIEPSLVKNLMVTIKQVQDKLEARIG